MYYKLDLNVLNITMLSKGYSMNKLAEKSGVGKTTISRIFREESIPRPETIFKIAKALEINIEELIIKE